MGKNIDLTGQRFGRLIVVSESQNRIRKNGRNWVCVCDCGKQTIVSAINLRRGKTNSCGCLNVEANTDHGHTSGGKITPEYRAWAHMKYRCYDEKCDQFNNYGGRGVIVCDRWLNSFENFLEDMGLKPSLLHSLDRFPDTNGNYFPDNCRWGTSEQQANNRRNNRIVEYMGEALSLTQAAKRMGMWEQNLRRELKKGATIPDVIDRLKRKEPVNYSFGFIQ